MAIINPYTPTLLTIDNQLLPIMPITVSNTWVTPDGAGGYYLNGNLSDPIIGSGNFDLLGLYNQAIATQVFDYERLCLLKNGVELWVRFDTPASGYKSPDIYIYYKSTPTDVLHVVNNISISPQILNSSSAVVNDLIFTFASANNQIGMLITLKRSDETYWYCRGQVGPVIKPIMDLILNGGLAPNDPYGLNENDTPSGGYGDFDYTSEDETPPSLPSLSAANAGFVTLWNPSISEVGDLADYLWGPTFSVATWQKLWNDPMECLLSLGIVPVAPSTGTRANIYFGNADTGIESAPITTQFVKADMGSLRIDGRSASYMDYAPYAKASIYLPYCGTYAMDVDEIMDADLALEYHIDIYTGACVAYLTINNRTNSDGSNVHNIMYQFTGNCLASIPVTSGDHSQLLQSLLFMGASIAATVATAGAGAASGGAIEGLAAEGDVVASSGVLGAATAGSAINTVMSMKPNVMHSGNLSSTAGLLGGQKPYVTFTWSNLCRPEDEYQLVGMPIQKSGTLSDFMGFTIVSACHMDNILCTDAERSMIEQALGRGVII